MCVRIAPVVLLAAALSGCGAAGDVAVALSTTPSATTTTAPTTTTPVATIPNDVVGKSAADVQAELTSLGFSDVEVVSSDNTPVTAGAGWHVVSVDGLGSVSPLTSKITVRVDKDAPPTTTVAPPPPHTTVKPAPPAYTPPPAPAPPAEVYYKNCAAARAAGAAPLHRGDPGYRPALDRDGDGIACEK
jgi:hypothetical protein